MSTPGHNLLLMAQDVPVAYPWPASGTVIQRKALLFPLTLTHELIALLELQCYFKTSLE